MHVLYGKFLRQDLQDLHDANLAVEGLQDILLLRARNHRAGQIVRQTYGLRDIRGVESEVLQKERAVGPLVQSLAKSGCECLVLDLREGILLNVGHLRSDDSAVDEHGFHLEAADGLQKEGFRSVDCIYLVLDPYERADLVEVVFRELVVVLGIVLQQKHAEAVVALAVADDVYVLLVRDLYGCEKPREDRASAHGDDEYLCWQVGVEAAFLILSVVVVLTHKNYIIKKQFQRQTKQGIEAYSRLQSRPILLS